MKRSSSGTAAPSLLVASLVAAALLLEVPAAAVAGVDQPARPAAPMAATAAQPVAAQPAAAQPAASAPAAPAPPEATPAMTTYYVALLRRGPDWTPKITPEVNRAIEGHMENIRRLTVAGDLLLAGPFLDQAGPGTLSGLLVLQARSLVEAKQLVAIDPAVQAGRLVAEVLPWLGPRSLQTLNASHPRQ